MGSSIHAMAWRVLGFRSWPGTAPMPAALGTLSLSHWTTKEVPGIVFFKWVNWMGYESYLSIKLLFKTLKKNIFFKLGVNGVEVNYNNRIINLLRLNFLWIIGEKPICVFFKVYLEIAHGLKGKIYDIICFIFISQIFLLSINAY